MLPVCQQRRAFRVLPPSVFHAWTNKRGQDRAGGRATVTDTLDFQNKLAVCDTYRSHQSMPRQEKNPNPRDMTKQEQKRQERQNITTVSLDVLFCMGDSNMQ